MLSRLFALSLLSVTLVACVGPYDYTYTKNPTDLVDDWTYDYPSADSTSNDWIDIYNQCSLVYTTNYIETVVKATNNVTGSVTYYTDTAAIKRYKASAEIYNAANTLITTGSRTETNELAYGASQVSYIYFPYFSSSWAFLGTNFDFTLSDIVINYSADQKGDITLSGTVSGYFLPCYYVHFQAVTNDSFNNGVYRSVSARSVAPAKESNNLDSFDLIADFSEKNGLSYPSRDAAVKAISTNLDLSKKFDTYIKTLDQNIRATVNYYVAGNKPSSRSVAPAPAGSIPNGLIEKAVGFHSKFVK